MKSWEIIAKVYLEFLHTLGLSGPRRPWSGSVRDFVLGTRLITGLGKHL
ncbi:glycolate oxidase FAD binding subunit, partial [Pseudomonas syringae pv. actinidiae ICMP 19079]